MVDNICPNCKDAVADAQPVISEEEAYRVAAKKNWYCYLLPILFFLPIMKEKKNIPGNIDVANNALWMFILNIASSLLQNIEIQYVSSLIGILAFALSILNLAMFVAALIDKAFKLPVVGNIKIIK